MKFFESTSFFLRVVVVDYYSTKKGITIKLMPMIHIGEEEFYRTILKESNTCDLVLVEGFNLKKSRISKQVGKYSEIAKELNMVSQAEFFKSNKIQAQIIKADLSGNEAEKEWGKLRFSEKLKYRLINPLKFYYHTHNMTREKLSKIFMTSAEEANLAYGPVEEEGTLENMMTKVRDDIVRDKIKITIEESDKNKTIGVMYGANHMKRIEAYITTKFDFKIQETNFVKVYDL